MTAPDQQAAVAEATLDDVLVELRAIRELLDRQDAEQALCPHGARGLCMSCVTPQIEYALTQLTNNVTNEVWGAMRRGR